MDSTKRTACVEAKIDGVWQPARLYLGKLFPNETRGQRLASFMRLQVADPSYKLVVQRRNHSPIEVPLGDINLDPKNQGHNLLKPKILYDRVVKSGLTDAEARALRDHIAA